MTRCERCRRSTPTPVKVVTQTRPKRYRPRPEANVFRRWIKGRPRRVVVDDPGGSGWEVVHEGLFCPGCAGAIREVPVRVAV